MRTRIDCRTNEKNESQQQHYPSMQQTSPTYSSVGNARYRQKKEEWKKKEETGAGAVALGLLAGAGIGVVAGILMAPDKGQTTRRRVADSASWVSRGITDALNTGKSKVSSWTGSRNKTENSPVAGNTGSSGTTVRSIINDTTNQAT